MLYIEPIVHIDMQKGLLSSRKTLSYVGEMHIILMLTEINFVVDSIYWSAVIGHFIGGSKDRSRNKVERL